VMEAVEGDERSIARHRERGKLPVRERIRLLCDAGTEDEFLRACKRYIETRGLRPDQ